MVDKREFLRVKKKYLEKRVRFKNINLGDLVWQPAPLSKNIDYSAAVVTNINVDENYVKVIDVSNKNMEKRYKSFLTESELIKETGISKNKIKEDYKKYEGIVKGFKKIKNYHTV